MKYLLLKKLEYTINLESLIHNACVITHNNLIHVLKPPNPIKKKVLIVGII